jgi:hypothetical protein
LADRTAAPRTFTPDPKNEHRVTVFGEARGPWRDSFAEAKWDAIQQHLASWDGEAREHFLAVPVAIEKRPRPAADGCDNA